MPHILINQHSPITQQQHDQEDHIIIIWCCVELKVKHNIHTKQFY